MRTNTTYAALKAGAGAMAVGLALVYSTAAFAQDATTPPADDANEGEAIVVTGTLLRSTANDTPSPVTVLSSETLDQRGIQTTQEAIQRLASNNGPAITQSFTANGAFAAGASAVSLRGLSTNSTLVLFNGMRAAYYPLSDDATRNFVDLNTIPDDIVDRVEVLRDGASSLYGADAIAGVVNVITKKQITGLSGRAEAGITQRGDASTYRLGLTGGFGDLSSDGYNVYASGFYYKQNALYNSDLPYPYNSQNQSGICRDGVCGPQVGPNSGSINPSSQGYAGWGDTALTSDRRLLATTFFVAPSDGSVVANPLGRYQFLNPTAGCIAGETPYNLTAGELAESTNQFAPTTVCQGDLVNQYGVVSPTVERFGGSARATKRFGDIEAFIEGNFIQSKVSYTGEPATIRGNANAGISFPRFSTYTGSAPNAPGSFALQLPVFVCPLVNGLPQATCNAGNGRLNPNNPFAASGQTALLLGRIPNLIEYNETLSKTYRIAGGVSGPINDDWDFNVNAVGMWNTVDRTSNGYVYIQRLLNVIADGSYNFVDPLSNSQETLDYLSPDNVTRSTSKLWSVEAFVRGKLIDLPGGPLQLAAGGQIRYESIDAPSANDDFAGPTERYFVLNAFGTQGNRHVYSLFGELGAPILDWAEVNVSGRWDKYSSGQNAFSPKAGVQFKPIDGLTIRGTWSRGFRIPSFGEANALPTTGFVTNAKGLFNDAYLAQYGCSVDTFNTCPNYIRSGSYGQTTLATPDLKPERSTSWTAGLIYQPTRNVQVSLDYYRIKKTGAITTSPFSNGLTAYYSGAAIPSEFNIIPDAPDPSNPTAKPRVAFIQTNFINANTIRSEGLDFAANARIRISDDITWTTNLEASYIIKLETEFPDGTVERYDGTLGNFALTAGNGTSKWHGSWQNTLDFGQLSLTGTVNYYGGYNLSAMDQGTERGDCGLLSAEFVKCDVPAYITVDMHTAYKVTDKFTFYVDVQNLFDDFPPIDPITYGANNYNPVQGGTGIFGRTIRAGVKFGF